MRTEVCVDAVEGVCLAREARADQVERCANILEGGTTRGLGMIRRARAAGGIAVPVPML